MDPRPHIAIIGLGYVGLPVAVTFAKRYPVIAYDKDHARILELSQGYDSTHTIHSNELGHHHLYFTHDSNHLQTANIYIVAVPTPVNRSNHPDLQWVIRASETIGQYLKTGDIVIYESTVYPGATEEDCQPILEATSGLTCNLDFFLGYSPERINPGDQTHRFDNMTKIVAASHPSALSKIVSLYQSVIDADIYSAPSIRVAEAAKIIENTQRDLNIALMNEFAIILNRMHIDTQEVLAAAGTKWNFMPFKPGLVGGHCIGVDPYYLTYQAERYGYHPQVILAGRRINDDVGKYIAQQAIKQMIDVGCSIKGAKIAVLGLTFKANCRDLRNSKTIDIIHELYDYGMECITHDPYADPKLAHDLYHVKLTPWEDIHNVEAIIIAVAHDQFSQYTLASYRQKCRGHPLMIDVNGILDRQISKTLGMTIWRL